MKRKAKYKKSVPTSSIVITGKNSANSSGNFEPASLSSRLKKPSNGRDMTRKPVAIRAPVMCASKYPFSIKSDSY